LSIDLSLLLSINKLKMNIRKNTSKRIGIILIKILKKVCNIINQNLKLNKEIITTIKIVIQRKIL